MYLLRLKEGHIYEAYHAFVKEIEPPIKSFVDKHHDVSLQFDNLEQIGNTPQFNTLLVSRHTIGFHYNYEKGNEVASTGLQALREAAQDGTLETQLQQDDHSFRFPFADRSMFQSWTALMNKQHGDGQSVDQKAYFQYLIEIGTAFWQYAEAVSEQWIKLVPT